MPPSKELRIPAESLDGLAIPVLTIHGTRDRNAPYGGAREWALSLPDARLLTIEGAGHASWIDDPETVFSALESFLAGEWPEDAEVVSALDPKSLPE